MPQSFHDEMNAVTIFSLVEVAVDFSWLFRSPGSRSDWALR